MKSVVTYIVFFVSTFSISTAQVNQTLEFKPFDDFPGVRMAPRVLSGQVYFETLPQPLTPTKVRFDIHFNSVANYVGDEGLERDTVVHIACSQRQMRVSDTLFVWQGPIYTDEPFTGEFEVTPLMSGVNSLSIHLLDQRVGVLEIRWCFDVDGNLHYLGNPADPNQKGSPECNRATYPAIFFSDDSIAFEPGPTSGASSQNLLRFRCIVEPLPQIGDTSGITCRMTALKDVLERVDIGMNARGIQIVQPPDPVIPPLLKGDQATAMATFVPLPVNGPHELTLTFSLSPSHPGQVIPLSLVFNDDGTLRFMGNRFNYNADIPQKYLPTAFQSLEEYEAAREEEKRVADSIKNADFKRF
jgi:hypothetical protein